VKRNMEGFTFTQNSKQQIIEGLAAAIKQGQTRFPADTPLDDELHSFEYVYGRTGVKYSAPSGLNDDCVCAYALAWYKFRYAPITTAQVNVSRPAPRLNRVQ
jgi:hypothetical protein